MCCVTFSSLRHFFCMVTHVINIHTNRSSRSAYTATDKWIRQRCHLILLIVMDRAPPPSISTKVQMTCCSPLYLCTNWGREPCQRSFVRSHTDVEEHWGTKLRGPAVGNIRCVILEAEIAFKMRMTATDQSVCYSYQHLPLTCFRNFSRLFDIFGL